MSNPRQKVTERLKPMGGIKAHSSSGDAWRHDTMNYSFDPEKCHCGAKALYRHGKKGYCKAHHADAVAITSISNRKTEFARNASRRSKG